VTQSEALMSMLESGPKSTNQLIQSEHGLAAEYRRIISELRKKLRPKQDIIYKHGKGGSGTYELVRTDMFEDYTEQIPLVFT